MEPSGELERLPVLARVLVGSRLVRRWVLGQSPDLDAGASLLTLDWIDGVVRDGCGEPNHTRFGVARGLCDLVDAVDAGLPGGIGPAEVSRFVRAAIRAVGDDPWVAPVQLAVLLAADIDQIGFACGELRLGEHDPLTQSVFQRLAPVHALTLTRPRPTPEEEAR
jgi:hypothetical protein